MSSHPGRARWAVVPSYGARWLLARLAAAGVAAEDVRREVEMLRAAGAPGFALDLEIAWQQLVDASRDHDRRHPRPRPQVVDEESLHGKPRLAVVKAGGSGDHPDGAA